MTHRSRFAVLLVAPVVVLTPVTSFAEDRGSTHWMIELEGGLATLGSRRDDRDLELMPHYGLAAGVGGKARGNPLRLYFVTRYNRSHVLGAHDLDLSFDELHASLRLLLPLWQAEGGGGLRFFAEVGLGPTFVTSDLALAGGGNRDRVRVRLSGHGGLGLQYRFTKHFSLGLRGDVSLTDADGLQIEETVGQVKAHLRPGVGLTTTFHF
jgi:hypothetical protein